MREYLENMLDDHIAGIANIFATISDPIDSKHWFMSPEYHALEFIIVNSLYLLLVFIGYIIVLRKNVPEQQKATCVGFDCQFDTECLLQAKQTIWFEKLLLYATAMSSCKCCLRLLSADQRPQEWITCIQCICLLCICNVCI
ncbi:hypothetical protein PPL_11026 [Heterostelium album PN500]|uniref:Uncharacterized protein n=1 Tax=Heterostelium pallidum (strain ATCC 26659 / Pp 5 / PN500) TaxID=670386 RepID=D3BSQ7_HETP5|nr:hypothetical protein PPL_11026 [Heterostelium album PN500]EFA75522.1 hypothetical protein PPL_11026 [Heterostelium album PN500]|eukprot:XP_020427656.1 hypothetical protein PPL_11026 [Heterostelium album PN500]